MKKVVSMGFVLKSFSCLKKAYAVVLLDSKNFQRLYKASKFVVEISYGVGYRRKT